MVFAVYGHGSWFAGVEDTTDVDILVVTDADAIDSPRVAVDVARTAGAPPGATLDVSVAHPERLTVYERACVLSGALLDGEPVEVKPIRWPEWAWAMRRIALDPDTPPGQAALAAIRAAWASHGRVVLPKSAVLREAVGGPMEGLATAAWPARRASTFAHPHLELALVGAHWSTAGDAATGEFDGTWSSAENRAAFVTRYKQVLTPDEVADLLARAAKDEQIGGWTKSTAEHGAAQDALEWCTGLANAAWWRYDLAGLDVVELHRYPVGTRFPAHVDRHPLTPMRVLNVVAMIQPATIGGRLQLNVGAPVDAPHLEPGDVLVFDAGVLHEVTGVTEGERVTLVTHAERRG